MVEPGRARSLRDRQIRPRQSDVFWEGLFEADNLVIPGCQEKPLNDEVREPVP